MKKEYIKEGIDMNAIRFENVSLTYNDKNKKIEALKNINLNFEENRIHVIMGPSGAGKTTLLKATTGLLSYDGTIVINEQNARLIPTKKRNISYVSENITLFPHLTIFDNIAFPLKILNVSKDEIRKRVLELANKFDLGFLLQRRPKQLSIGQLSRVLLAKELIKKPEILLLDEPFAALDEQNKYKIRMILKKILIEEQITTILVTHNPSIALAMGDYIHILKDGSLYKTGKKEDIINSGDEFVKGILGQMV